MADDTTGNEAVEGSWSPKRPRTTAEQRAKRHEGSTDPEVLAEDIEKTREELAQTLDAIADKVSPKRVAKRTTKKAGDAAKEGVQDAADAVKETAASATAAVKETAAAVKEKATSVKDDVRDRASGSKDADPDRSPLEPATSVEVDSATPVAATPSPLPAGTLSVDAGALPQPEADPLAGLGETPPASTTGSLADAADAAAEPVQPAGADLPPYRPSVPPPAAPSRAPVFAGAAAAAVVALLLLRRRRR